MVKVSPVASLEKVLVDVICRQHLFLGSVRQGEHPFLFVGFVGRIFFPLEMCTWPSICRKFLFFRNARTGLSLNAVARSGWVWRRCQCLLIVFWMGGRCLWRVVVKGVLSEGVFILSCSNASRGLDFAFSRCFWVSLVGYPRSFSFLVISSMASFASCSFVQIFFALRNCPYGMLVR